MYAPKPFLVAIVDDEAFVRFNLKALIASFPEFKLTIEAVNGRDFFEQLHFAKQPPHAITLDIGMPEMDGRVTQRQLQKAHPDIKTVVVSASDHPFNIQTMIALGANAYLHRSNSHLFLHQALLSVIGDGVYYSDIAGKKVFDKINSMKDYPKNISPKEEETLVHIGNGLSYKAIADKMHISEDTVKSYKKNLCDKLHLHTQNDLILFAIRNEFVIYPPHQLNINFNMILPLFLSNSSLHEC